jgi:hypothetical protein
MRDIPANQLKFVSESLREGTDVEMKREFAQRGVYQNNIDVETNLEEKNQFDEELVINRLLKDKVDELKKLIKPGKAKPISD